MRTSKLQIRRGLQSELPKLAPGELGFCTDTLRLFIGSDSYANGSTQLTNTEIYTDVSLQNILDSVNQSNISTADLVGQQPSITPTGIRTSDLSNPGYWFYIIRRTNINNVGILDFSVEEGKLAWSNKIIGPDIGVTLSATIDNANINLNYQSIGVSAALLVAELVQIEPEKSFAEITLANLNQTYTGSELSVTSYTIPKNLSVELTYNNKINPPTQAGSYLVICRSLNTFYPGFTSGIFNINQAIPEIIWETPNPIITPGTPLSNIQLNATTDVVGTFEYTPGFGSILSPGLHTLSVNFSPVDTTNYAYVSSNVQLIVDTGSPLINWVTPNNISYGTLLSNIQLNASCFANGSFTYNYSNGEILPAGTYDLFANFSPSDTVNFSPASASVQLIVEKYNANILWDNPSSIVYETKLSNAQLNAEVDSDGVLEYDPTIGAVLNAGSANLSVKFIPFDTSNLNTIIKTVPITVFQCPTPINWNNPANIKYGTPLTNLQLNATCDYPGEFLYNPNFGNILPIGQHALNAIFIPDDEIDYNQSNAAVMLSVVYGGNIAVFSEIPSGVQDGSNIQFQLINANIDTNTLLVSKNGQILTRNIDYISFGNNLIYIIPPKSTDIFQVFYMFGSDNTGGFASSQTYGIQNNSNLIFSLPSCPDSPSSLKLFYNGQLLIQDLHYKLSGNQLFLTFSPTRQGTLTALYRVVQENFYVNRITPFGNINAINNIFLLPVNPTPPSSLQFYINGVLQQANIDYRLSGNVITTNISPNFDSTLTSFFRVSNVEGFVDGITPTGIFNGNNSIFTLPNIPSPLSSLQLFYNGLLQTSNIDYNINGNSITITIPPKIDNSIIAFYSTDNSNIIFQNIPVGNVDGVNNSFVLNNTPIFPLNLKVNVNGVLQQANIDYRLSGNVITFIVPPSANSSVLTYYRNTSILNLSTYNYVDAIIPSGNINGINNTFTLPTIPSPPSSLQLFLNGFLLKENVDFSLSGNVITYIKIPNRGNHIAFYNY